MTGNRKCEICGQLFYAKPFHIKKGWGKFCSAKCQYQSFKKGITTRCLICEKDVYRSPNRFEHSKSGNFFCSKSCQTIWRNKEFSGNKSKLWKDGWSTYREVISKSTLFKKCKMCGEQDLRVLAVHHIDKNRKNYKIDNLVWLCHNCHHLVHSDKIWESRLKEILQVAN